MSPVRRFMTVVGLVAAAIFVLATEHFIFSGQRKISPTSYSPNGLGTSLFYTWLSETRPGALSRQEGALLEAKQLQGLQSYALFSPGNSVSELKQKLLDDFVKNGGTLFLSAHNEGTLDMLRPLLRHFLLDPAIEENPDFQNGLPQWASPSIDEGIFRAEENYAFYSLWRYKNCRAGNTDCYLVHANHFRGQIYLFLGLPPLSNGLILSADNHRLASRIAAGSLPLAVDEFDHLYSNRDLLDLALKPAFFLPMTGMALALLLFLAFGESPSLEEKAAQKAARGGFHETGYGVVAAAVHRQKGRAPALNYLLSALAQRSKSGAPPQEEGALSSAKFLAQATVAIQKHKAWLESKGRANR